MDPSIDQQSNILRCLKLFGNRPFVVDKPRKSIKLIDERLKESDRRADWLSFDRFLA